jgi:hypothetical protein
MLESDLGLLVVSRENHLLVIRGQPALVMVNGTGAIVMFEHLHADALTWQGLRYDSVDFPRKGRKGKRLRHW